MILELLSIALLSLFFWFMIVRWQALGKRDRLGLKGPPTSFIFGNLTQISDYMRENGPYQHHMQKDVWQKEYGDVYGIYLGGHLQIYMHDIEMVKEVLVKQFPNFIDRMQMVMTEVEPMKSNLICNRGQRWKDVRSVVSPTFSSGKLKQLAYIMDEKTVTFMEIMAEKAAAGKTFDIFENYQALTLDVIGQTAFAIQVDCQRDFNDPFYVNCRAFFEGSSFETRPFLMLAAVLSELDVALRHCRRFTDMGRAERRLVDRLRVVVDSRCLDYQNFKSMDMLQLLVEEARESKRQSQESGKKVVDLTKEDIVGNCYLFLLAGYETTSTALAFTTWLLALHPQAQAKLQDEIDTFLPEVEPSDPPL